jgi:methionyl-tRNA synthetase
VGDPGLPDDWGMYYGTCSTCGGRYHASGCETCRCEEEGECETCGEWFDHTDLTHGVCKPCREEAEDEEEAEEDG